jgi:hypothetical protein
MVNIISESENIDGETVATKIKNLNSEFDYDDEYENYDLLVDKIARA